MTCTAPAAMVSRRMCRWWGTSARRIRISLCCGPSADSTVWKQWPSRLPESGRSSGRTFRRERAHRDFELVEDLSLAEWELAEHAVVAAREASLGSP